jgi:hypothetical protein
MLHRVDCAERLWSPHAHRTLERMMNALALVCALLLGHALPAMAHTGDAQLPPIATLLHDVERNQDAAEARKRDYTYHLHRETQDFDKNGNVKKTVTEDDESFRIDGVLLNRAVARNGKPLSAEEAGKESERIDKAVAKAREQREKLKAQGKTTDADGHQELSVSRILELGRFTNERRVVLRGRPTIVIDYAGDPEAKTKDRFETIVRDLVGTVWIDEADRTIAQLQGHFLNDFKIAGGLLADVKKGSSFHATFVKINEEAWLPAELGGEGRIRIFLFTGFDGRMKMVTSDYKKYRANVTILPSNREVDSAGEPIVQPAPK